MKKKLILCAIIAVMAVSPFTSAVSFAETPAYTAETGELSEYTLEIHRDPTGEWYGDYRFNRETGKITSFNDEVTGAIEIPSEIDGVSVTEIAEGAFCWSEQLTSVTIPDSVTIVGRAAFANCEMLENIALPQTLEEIGEYAFYRCGKLTSIDIPPKVKVIPPRCFRLCFCLESISLPDNLEVIGDSAFEWTGIESIDIPDSVKEIQDCAFDYCTSLKEIKLSAVEKIGEYCFDCCKKLEKAVIKGTITELPEGTFWSCWKLKDVVIPETITQIGKQAFAGTSIETIILPDALESIGMQAFMGCENLKSIKLPGKLQSIGKNAFQDCTNISAVEMPASLKSLGEEIIDDSDVPVVIYYRGTEEEWNAIDIEARERTTAGMSVLFESAMPYSFEISGEPTDQNSVALSGADISEITKVWVEVHKVDNSLYEMTILMVEYDGDDRLIKANFVPVKFDEDSTVSEIKMPVEFRSDMRKLMFLGIRDMKIVEPVMAQYYIYFVY